MAAINVDLDYFGHRKVRLLIGRLGKGSEALPLRIWCYCGKYHCEDGRLDGYSPPEIEELANWWGKAGEMVRVMVELKFLDLTDGVYSVHGWAEHQGHIHSLKVKAKHAAEVRWARIRDAPAMPRASPGQCPILTKPTTSPPGGGGKTKREAEVARLCAERRAAKAAKPPQNGENGRKPHEPG